MPSRVSNANCAPSVACVNGHVQLVDEVVALALESLVGADLHVDVEVAVAPAADAGGAASSEPQRRAGVDAGGNVDRVRLVLDLAALAAAIRARLLDDLAHAAALRARAGGDHLAEDRLAHAAHLTGAAALGARLRTGAGRGARGLARLARDRGANGDRVLTAEHGPFEVDLGHHLEVLAAGGPPRPPPPNPVAPPPKNASKMSPRLPKLLLKLKASGTGRRPRLPARTGRSAAVRSGSESVSYARATSLNCVSGLGIVGVGVGVELHRPAPEGALDVVLGGVAPHAEQLVVVLTSALSQMMTEALAHDGDRREGLRVVHARRAEHADRAGLLAFDLVRSDDERALGQRLQTGLGSDRHLQTHDRARRAAP